jgi:hypothetical protein
LENIPTKALPAVVSAMSSGGQLLRSGALKIESPTPKAPD